MPASKNKKVKLQPKHRALVYGQKVVPWLSVSGIWLAQAGFNVGDHVEILVSENQLIINPAFAKASADKPVSDGDQRN
jgi:toxic protein SymE